MEIVDWRNLNKEDIYCCFSFPLFKFIVAHGLEPIAKEEHPKTKKIFSVIMKGDKLQALLTEWTENRPNVVKQHKSSSLEQEESGEK